MIVIPRELFADFQAIAREGFIQKKLDVYAAGDPAVYDAIGEENYRRYVEAGIEKAELYGLDSKWAVNVFLSLMDNLGQDFDRDPLLGWARPMAEDDSGRGLKRLEEVEGLLGAFVKNAVGDSGRRLEAALRRFIDMDLKSFTDIQGERDIVARLQALYPEKFQSLGEADFPAFLPRAREKAGQMGLFSPAGWFLTAYAMFMLGASFASDRRYRATFDPNNFFPPPEQALMAALKKHFTTVVENIERQRKVKG